ncbi:spore coat polysaccharide biosynthesis protein SpsF [Anseongella ginsenosidimutans]|uniref:Spore coat polysaccharide biosynthesis protein SpsF n=1 Tax=Anseongella ginsenosidimutans TaxID=496056 RepID=A0A4R3KNU6_9SPHI|nr:NTP transferase domain-containing protein [Anseongella ginsenosidimutans]QEC52138.1 3-deoxy-manno-octulosonate cytidylyltransferase [Anseongella ginsenosidimutans]TCS84833.1 spore coat polysaccharide biosynthesis protein SpsF [Anseongella ginsenosidimutans]
MKIGYFITARLKSSRLKQKVILPLNNLNVIEHVIRRCQLVSGIEGVVMCTSTNSQDALLYDYALKHQIKFFPGSEHDVLARLLDAAKYYGFDAFLSITADNPLHSPHIANIIVDWVRREPSDFVFTSGVPIGLAPYFITTKALEVAVEMKKESDTEIWGPFVNRPDFFNIGYLDIKTALFAPNIRLTCDYLEDYFLLEDIYRHFIPGYCPSLFEIARLIQEEKVVLQNLQVEQRTVDDLVLEKINDNFEANKRRGEEIAKNIGLILRPGKRKLEITL